MKTWLLAALLFIFTGAIAAPPVYVLPAAPGHSESVTDFMLLVNDSAHRFSPEVILAGDADAQLGPNELHENIFHAHNHGFDGWGKLSIYNPSDSAKVIALLPSPDVDYISVYWKENGALQMRRAGSLVKYSEKAFPFIRITLAPHDTTPIALHLQGDDYSQINNSRISVSLADPLALQKHEDASQLIFGLFYGILIALTFYSVTVYFMTRKDIYLGFIAFIVSVLFFYLKDNGIGAALLWGNSPLHVLGKYGNNLLFGPLAVVSGFLFCRRFLDIGSHYPKLDRVLGVLIYIQLFAFIRLLIGFHELIRLTQNNLVIITFVIFILVGIRLALKKNGNAIVFLVVFLSSFLGIGISVLSYSKIIPASALTQYAGQIGIGVTALIFSVAIGLQIWQIKIARRRAEKQEIETLKEIERITKEQNLLLEQKVEERSRELQEAQDELLRREKLASLGKLTTNLAHEIQNPLNFVNNFSELSDELLVELRAAQSEEEFAEVLSQLKENLSRINYHGKRADIILKSMQRDLREGRAGELFE